MRNRPITVTNRPTEQITNRPPLTKSNRPTVREDRESGTWKHPGTQPEVFDHYDHNGTKGDLKIRQRT